MPESMNKKIPKSFKLFASTVEVVFDNTQMSNESTLGTADCYKRKITLCDTYKGEKLKKDVILESFYHEKVHMILDSMGEHNLSANEKFVEIFAMLIRQSIETEEY